MDLEKNVTKNLFDSMLRVSLNQTTLVPTSEIAKLHGVDTKVINKSFRRHKDDFVNGKDYYMFTREGVIGEFGEEQGKYLVDTLFTNNKQKVVYLFTYKGYFNFVKTINSKHAWKMFHVMKEIVFNVIEASEEELHRRVSKEVRKNLTEAIEDSGENERMHNHGHATYTLMIYKLMGIKEDYLIFKKENPKGNFKDSLDEDTLSRLSIAEDLVKPMLRAGMQYDNIKSNLGHLFLNSKGLLT